MTTTTRPLAPPAPSDLALRRPVDGTTEPWREAITDYRPPAGPDGCWASGDPGVPQQEDVPVSR